MVWLWTRITNLQTNNCSIDSLRPRALRFITSQKTHVNVCPLFFEDNCKIVIPVFTALESVQSSDMISEYFSSADYLTQKRYLEKLQVEGVSLPDPYGLGGDVWSDDMSLWPDYSLSTFTITW